MKRFTEKELRELNQSQILEILKYKWLESEKHGHDIGEVRAAYEWVSKYSADFRKAFDAKLLDQLPD